MTIPSNKARPKDHRTRDFPLVDVHSHAPLHTDGRRPPGPGTNVSPGPVPTKMPKAK